MVYEGVIALDVFGIFDVMSMADELLRQRGMPECFSPVLCALDLEPVRLANGVRVMPDRRLDGMMPGDRLVVPGCFIDRTDEHRAVARYLRAHPPEGMCLSICTGAFVLAGAGLLDGLQATTHWAYMDAFIQAFPNVRACPDALFVRQDRIWTSAGVCAGIDLALALVREEAGAQVALEVAHMLVVHAPRPGLATQRSAHLTFTPTAHEQFHALQYHVFSHVSEDLSVEALARHMRMSPRHFARQCREHLGVTPGELVRRARVSVAHGLIQCTDMGFEQVARRVGLDSAEVLRRHISKAFGVPPSVLRTQQEPMR